MVRKQFVDTRCAKNIVIYIDDQEDTMDDDEYDIDGINENKKNSRIKDTY